MFNTKYFNTKSEFLDFKTKFEKAKGTRGDKKYWEDLETYIQNEWGKGYEVFQPRTPKNNDCIIMRADGAEFSSRHWMLEIFGVYHHGCNKITQIALEWVKERCIEDDFFKEPIEGMGHSTGHHTKIKYYGKKK